MEKAEKVVVTLAYMIKELEALQNEHIRLAREMLEANNGTIFPFDLFATGVFNRSLKLIEGFNKLIPDNFISAAPLVRLQLDNYLRSYAVQRVNMNAHEFALAVMNGTRIKDFQDKDSKRKLNDGELAILAEKMYPGLRDFYNKASDYIHFSDTLIFHSVATNKDTGGFNGHITKNEPYVTEKLRIEAAISMYNFTKLILDFLSDWTFTKNNPELVAELREFKQNS